MLEPLFVYTFVKLLSLYSFLLAAKFVFRFGVLSRAKDRKLTEYILIGTLISFGLAILAALSYLSTIIDRGNVGIAVTTVATAVLMATASAVTVTGPGLPKEKTH